LATAGEGVTFVPAMAVDPAHHPDLVYLPFSPVVPTREIGVIWRLTAPLSPIQRFLIDILRQVLNAKP
jgi:DNA-binding transcriptional LysR family regulator